MVFGCFISFVDSLVSAGPVVFRGFVVSPGIVVFAVSVIFIGVVESPSVCACFVIFVNSVQSIDFADFASVSDSVMFLASFEFVSSERFSMNF